MLSMILILMLAYIRNHNTLVQCFRRIDTDMNIYDNDEDTDNVEGWVDDDDDNDYDDNSDHSDEVGWMMRLRLGG